MLPTALARMKPAKRQLLSAAAAFGLACLAGCGGDRDVGHVVAVGGRVYLDGEPLSGRRGTVTFVPDLDKGNSSTLTPSGTLGADGYYTLYYAQGKKGAQPGWYKVQVSAAQSGPGMGIQMPRPKGVPGASKIKPPINSKYANPKTSGLRIEVVESPGPGAYDLKLTK